MKRLLIAFSLLISSTPAFAYATMATYYNHGARTANGERFNPSGLTCAHRTLPFGTMLRVSYKGKSVVVRVNDRGPFTHAGIDLAQGAARRIGLHSGRVDIARLN